MTRRNETRSDKTRRDETRRDETKRDVKLAVAATTGELQCTANVCRCKSLLNLSCIYVSVTFYPDVFCCCNFTVFYDWCECVMSALGTTIHS